MKPAATREQAFVTAFLVSSVIFTLYTRADFLLGIVIGLTIGSATYILLRAREMYRVRKSILLTFTMVMWLSFAFTILWLGFDTLQDWVMMHKKIDLIPSAILLSGVSVIPCPFVTPQSLFGGAYGATSYPGANVVFFPTLESFLVIAGLYLLTAMVLGRGWCSWICPFGGITEAFMSGKRKRWSLSRLRVNMQVKGRPTQLGELKDEVRDVRYGILVGWILLSMSYWIQPFCTVCWAGLASWFTSPFNLFLVGLILIVFFILLPFMTKKKWCFGICPIGAGIVFLGKLSPFAVKIDKTTCNECYVCLHICPTYAITQKAIKATGKPNPDCDSCGACIEQCPRDSADIYFRGTMIPARSWFILLAMLLVAAWYLWFVATLTQLTPLVFAP